MNLDFFFSPKSVAVVGASHTPGKVGYSILHNLLKNFTGNIYPVNPDTTPILGKTVYPSIKSISNAVDLVVIAIPAINVPKVLKECVDKKIKAVVIISGGFSEIGEKGKKLEEKCKKIIKGKKTKVIGPNCIGIYDSSSGLDTLFLTEERMGRPKPGNIAFISQSGAVGSTVLDWLSGEKIGISKFVSYGNAMDINETDFLEYFSNDDNTKVIAVYLEGIKAYGKKFIEALNKTTARKPVVILKAGKTEKGSKAVASHTGSLAGNARIYSAVFKQFGAIEANDWEELFDFCKAFSTQPLPKGDDVLIVTDGGGFGVLAADEAERQGIKLKEPSNSIKKYLYKKVPPYVSLHNPIDLSGDVNAERYKVVIESCIKQYDGIMPVVLFQVPLLEESIVDILVEMKKYGKPILCCASGGKFTENLSDKLEANGIPVYPSPERAVKTFVAMLKYARLM